MGVGCWWGSGGSEVPQLRGGVLFQVCILAAALVATVLASHFAASPAGATHIPGATYTGTVSGGGTIELRVSPDGASVTYFKYAGVPGLGTRSCGLETASTFSAPISGHAFTWGLAGLRALAGSFTGTQTAAGTVEEAFCFNGARSWTAATTALPPRTPPATPVSPSPPARSTTPYFRGGHESTKLLRGPKRVVRVRAKFRSCAGTPPFRVVIRQRRRVNKAVVAEATLRKALTGGRRTPEPECRDYVVTWRLAAKLYGAGHIVFTLMIIDATGAESPTPSSFVRAPKR
jgi:hypothetical protein